MTCLCLTRNRRQWLPQAIRCYQNQTYPNRELLILADGEPVADLVPNDDPTIRLLVLGEEGRFIGEKRNFGCERAAGSVIAHWDDDDYSEPGRLEHQVGRLLASGKSVTGYRTLRFTDGRKQWRYDGKADTVLGTSLCFWRAWWKSHPFEPVHIEEDGRFAKAACLANELDSAIEGNELMVATIHAGNTSPRPLHGSRWVAL